MAAPASHASGVDIGRRLRTTHPGITAVFATADILAIGIMEGLRESGATVRDDVSVVGFDNLDLCAYVTPKLTTIAQDISGKAATAVRMLLTSIESGKRPTAPVILDVRLVERASTAPPPTPAARHRPR